MTSSDPPVVLVVDDDEKLLETYEMWLDAEYDLRMATSGEDALEQLDDDVEVVLLDRLMSGLTGDEVLERIRERGVSCQVAMVTAVEPDFDIGEMPFDAYVTKAIDRETVKGTVERLLARSEYDEVLRDAHAVAEKIETIESKKTRTELASNDTYQNLRDRFAELKDQLAAQADELDRDEIGETTDELPEIKDVAAGSSE